MEDATKIERHTPDDVTIVAKHRSFCPFRKSLSIFDQLHLVPKKSCWLLSVTNAWPWSRWCDAYFSKSTFDLWWSSIMTLSKAQNMLRNRGTFVTFLLLAALESSNRIWSQNSYFPRHEPPLSFSRKTTFFWQKANFTSISHVLKETMKKGRRKENLSHWKFHLLNSHLAEHIGVLSLTASLRAS